MSSDSSAAEHTPEKGLSGLHGIDLGERHAWLLETASAKSQGSAAWRRRKRSETHDILALAEIAPRLEIGFVDLQTDLRVLARMRVVVPCMPEGEEELTLAREAVLGITYEQKALYHPMPGFAFVQILTPSAVHHPNVSRGPNQRLCMGAMLPAGVRLRELVLGAYGALTLQNLDDLDDDDDGEAGAGVGAVIPPGTRSGVAAAPEPSSASSHDGHSGLPYWSRRGMRRAR
jgi:hypothetical protein